jgi:hypothetical protein
MHLGAGFRPIRICPLARRQALEDNKRLKNMAKSLVPDLSIDETMKVLANEQ